MPSKRTVSAFISVLAASLVLTGGKKIYDISAPPHEAKKCDFVFPPDASQAASFVTTAPSIQEPPLVQKGGTINDASCLNKTSIYGVVDVATEDDIRHALAFATSHHLKVTSAGQRHSMGGQTFTPNGLILDMKSFKKMSLDERTKTLTVQSGATWDEIQNYLDKRGLAVKAMQSINIFTVGGTLSVNAHGIAHNPGPVAPTVKSVRVMMSDGSIQTASIVHNADLFRHVIGGYGLFGVILDAQLEVMDNEAYQQTVDYMNYDDFPAFYDKRIKGNDKVGLFYARLSVAPDSYLKETATHIFERVPYNDPLPPLQPQENIWLYRLIINFSKTGSFGRWVRWQVEKYIEPKTHACLTRNQAIGQDRACIATRNQEMYDSMRYLKNRLNDTDILQEYFIPRDHMPAFVDGLRNVVQNTHANLLNVTIRNVEQDRITALPYAKGDMFAFVLYFNQKLNDKDSSILQQTTSDLINLSAKLGGRFYLPYQLTYSKEQLEKAYPEIPDFFAAKKKYDPTGLFSNKFYEKYGI